MHEDATAMELRPHVRLLHGMRRPANWLQLVRFGLVGGMGFVVNIAVYTLVVHGVGVEYRVASVVAWLVAAANNFFWNRHWTFDARDGLAHYQAIRFLLVSLAAEVLSLLLLTVLVESGGLSKVPAQAIAVAAATATSSGASARGPDRGRRSASGDPGNARGGAQVGTYTLIFPSRRLLCRRW
jgi:putative flippase GtrA